MVDYGRNLVGNIKVKTRSGGGSFVDMGKTKSDIEKNAQEMEKLVNEIKSDPRHSSDSGRMINDLKEDIQKLRLIQYDSQGKPTEESLMALYGKDVKNAKFKDKGGVYSVYVKKAKVIGNKNVVTLKSIPKRIDLDKKSDLEKAIKDITDLSKDYERSIKVNGDDKYMHDKFVGLLKEANDEVKELKQVLSKLA